MKQHPMFGLAGLESVTHFLGSRRPSKAGEELGDRESPRVRAQGICGEGMLLAWRRLEARIYA